MVKTPFQKLFLWLYGLLPIQASAVIYHCTHMKPLSDSVSVDARELDELASEYHESAIAIQFIKLVQQWPQALKHS